MSKKGGLEMKTRKKAARWPVAGLRLGLLLAVMSIGSGPAEAQILKPVKWQYASKKISDTEAVVMLNRSAQAFTP